MAHSRTSNRLRTVFMGCIILAILCSCADVQRYRHNGAPSASAIFLPYLFLLLAVLLITLVVLTIPFKIRSGMTWRKAATITLIGILLGTAVEMLLSYTVYGTMCYNFMYWVNEQSLASKSLVGLAGFIVAFLTDGRYGITTIFSVGVLVFDDAIFMENVFLSNCYSFTAGLLVRFVIYLRKIKHLKKFGFGTEYQKMIKI